MIWGWNLNWCYWAEHWQRGSISCKEHCCAFYFLTWELQCKELAYCFGLRLLRTFVGVLPCPLGKNAYAHHFKGKHGILYIIGRLNKCRFSKKKHKLPVFFNATKENCKTDHASFNQTNELIGYQNSQIYVKFGLNIPYMSWNKTVLGIFEIYNILPVAIFNAMPIMHSLLLELDRLIKKITS